MTPTQETGMMVNTNTLLVSLPANKSKHIWAAAIRISNMTSLSAHLLSHFLGKLSAATQLGYSTSPTILPLPTERFTSGWTMRFSFPSQRELSWWRNHLSKWNGKSLKYQPE